MILLLPKGPGHVHAGAGACGGVGLGGGGGAVLHHEGHAPGQEQGRHPHAHQGRDTVHYHLSSLLQLSTNIREISQCQEKALLKSTYYNEDASLQKS